MKMNDIKIEHTTLYIEPPFLKETINDLTDIHDWVRCDERLPEVKGEYLVAFYPCWWGNVKPEKIFVGLDSFRGKTSWAKCKNQKVIAWRSKPEYKEE